MVVIDLIGYDPDTFWDNPRYAHYQKADFILFAWLFISYYCLCIKHYQ